MNGQEFLDKMGLIVHELWKTFHRFYPSVLTLRTGAKYGTIRGISF